MVECPETKIENFPITIGEMVLISDVASIRASALRLYGPGKLLTATNLIPEHTNDHNLRGDEGFSKSFVEWFLLGETHVQVITDSCFGKSASLRSGRRLATYFAEEGHKCELVSSLNWNELDSQWFDI